MNRNFTPLTFSDINTTYLDLVADAYGYEYIYADLLNLLNAIEYTPCDRCVNDLLKQL